VVPRKLSEDVDAIDVVDEKAGDGARPAPDGVDVNCELVEEGDPDGSFSGGRHKSGKLLNNVDIGRKLNAGKFVVVAGAERGGGAARKFWDEEEGKDNGGGGVFPFTTGVTTTDSSGETRR